MDKVSASGKTLTEFSNAIVALHRRHFGRGPGSAKSFVSEGIAVCVLSDVYTPVERTLIDAGQLDHVRESRMLHQAALEDEYRQVAEEVLGRKVEAVLSAIHVDPDVATETFLLGD
ncbi:MAG: Na-translocating system protein MpsC family protein [Methanosarcina sp.]